MQFQVPQFIEVEDKIFGPLTFKQFVYIAGGAGLSYLLWRVLPLYLAAPFIIGAAGLGTALAFMQYNGRPFILALEHGFYYLTRSKLYLWNNERRERNKIAALQKQTSARSLGDLYVPHLSESKLHELAWSLDIKEKIAAGIASDTDREEVAPVSALVAPVRTARSALIQ
jgi:PrgI family protein